MSNTSNIFEGLFKGEEAEKYQVLRTFFESENIEFKTDLSLEEIDAIVATEFINDYIKNNWGIDLKLDEITKAKKKHKVSHNREGRKEAFKALQTKEEEEDKSKLKKALGL